jgi:hypothetical protein
MTLEKVEAYTTLFHSFDPEGAHGPEIKGLLTGQDYQALEASEAIDLAEGIVIGEFDLDLQKKFSDIDQDVQAYIGRVWADYSALTLSSCLSPVSMTSLTNLIRTNTTVIELKLQFNFLTGENYQHIIDSALSNNIIQSLFIATLGPIVSLMPDAKEALLRNKRLAHHNRCRRVMTLQMHCFKAMTEKKHAPRLERTGFEDYYIEELESVKCFLRKSPSTYYKAVLEFIRHDEFNDEDIITYFD